MTLDANYILARYRAATLGWVIPFLNDLPLLKFSFEARSIQYTKLISDEEWVRRLRAEGKEVWTGEPGAGHEKGRVPHDLG